MKIAIGSDKSGFVLKEAVKQYLVDGGYEVDDLGTRDVDQAIPFFEVAPVVASAIQQGKYDKGILCCGTGMGMSVAANKFKGVTAAVCESVYSAKMSRAVNDANILCMGGWLVADWLGIEMAKVFLETRFTQDLEEWRKKWLKSAKTKVAELEDKQFNG
ncbi:MAG: RpiB/LacA/LacB family sugar-phosphate isomerase [Caldicoprobacterales bacterium]|jgi:ribose 5-phosphate isomerase B